MITQSEYEDRERSLHFAFRPAVERAPLAERKRGAAEWADALRDPDLLTERASWLLKGDYGKGAHMSAWAIVSASPRSNRIAAIAQLLAAVEWRTSGDHARRAYLGLTAAERQAADGAILAAVRHLFADQEIAE